MGNVLQIDGVGNSRLLLECFSRADCERLYRHLHNDNEPFAYVHAFRDSATGEKLYRRAKRIPFEQAISWSLDTSAGRSKKLCAFVPYSANDEAESRWGAMDFDAHDGDTERASRLALAAWPLVAEIQGTFPLLEESGSGGFHLWCITTGFRPVVWWHGNLLAIAQHIGAPLVDGVCELRPLKADATRGSEAYGLRAPGAWNPGTERHGLIVRHEIDGLLATLAEKERVLSEKEYKQRKSFSLLGQVSEKTTKHGEWYRRFPITAPGTRHGRLRALVGHIFPQVSAKLAEANARAQFRHRAVSTNADEVEHMEEFWELWNGLSTLWKAGLTDHEQNRYGQLVTDRERDGFRIVRGWDWMARQRGKNDFGLSAQSLGDRLEMTRQGAEGIAGKFERLGMMMQTRPYIPRVQVAHYRWISPP
jgi:hypothetical protein